MARVVSSFVCSACAYASPRWLGRCPGCGEWNTLVEEASRAPARRPRAGARPRPLAEVPLSSVARIPTGTTELDRVLGGGLVPGSLVLVGGEPGVGKSSLLLQALGRMAAGGRRVLLVSGEESPAQVRLRAERLGALEGVSILAETDVEAVCEAILGDGPDVCVVDSVQTLFSPELSSAPGSVAQVRDAADRLLRLAKAHGIAIVLVGHVTKEGALAGPRVLEHLVDAVLQLEGDRYRFLRVLRAVKNRFGSTNEIGIFEMTGGGLEPVADPSCAFGAGEDASPGSMLLPAIEGSRPLLLEVQALVAPSELAVPRRQATGFDRNRLSMILAVLARHAGVALGSSDVFVNVAGGVRVEEPAADLAVALAVASAQRGAPPAGARACFGEIGLTGRLRGVAQPARRLAEAGRLGVGEVLAPAGTEGADGVRVRTADTLRTAIHAAFSAA